MENVNKQADFACIWDMDGVLVDSSMAHFQAWQLFAAEMDREFTEDQFLASLGMRTPEILGQQWGIYDPADQVASMSERKEELFRSQATAVEALPGSGELLRSLSAQGWRQAVASGSTRANVDLLLNALDITALFDTIVSANDVQLGKPNPAVFLKAMEKLGVAPIKSVVIEDATNGIQAAKAAGAFAVGVTTNRSRADLEQAGADLVVDSLAELTPEMLEGYLRVRNA